MLALPPPPPPPTPPPLPPPPTTSQKQNMPTTLNKIVISNPIKNQLPPTPSMLDSQPRKSRNQIIILHPRRTNPIVWCGAVVCLIFSLALIFFGIATLIIFLVIRPKIPLFDTPSANLTSIYFDSPEYFNGNFTFLANFTNPNHKIDVRFEYLDIELYYFDELISTQALQPFTQRERATRMESVHLISSLVYLPSNLAVRLQKQVQSNSIVYNIRGTFRVRATIGMIHFSYWLHSRCQLEMTGPPTGSLVARSCRTKR